MTQHINKQNLITPIAIIVAGILIAIGLYTGLTKNNTENKAKTAQDYITNANKIDPVQPLTKKDHIRGDINAPIVLIEYSDTQCPFCKRYHETMNSIFNEYKNTGKVAWVYRHFPLSFHKKALPEAIATECVADLGGNDAFWKFIDLIYKNTGSNDNLDHALLPKFAIEAGVDEARFNQCLISGKFDDKIKEEMSLAAKAGVSGTPHTFIKLNDEYIPVVSGEGQSLGALSKDMLKNIIDDMLKEIK